MTPGRQHLISKFTIDRNRLFIGLAKPVKMRLLTLTFTLLPFLLPIISATALSYKLAPNEKACFYATVEEAGAKVAVYFAVQSGGSFDVDYTVVGPKEHMIMAGNKERQGDFVFAAGEAGEHRVCFDNDMSTFTDKMVDFEITVGSPPSSQSDYSLGLLPLPFGQATPPTVRAVC